MNTKEVVNCSSWKKDITNLKQNVPPLSHHCLRADIEIIWHRRLNIAGCKMLLSVDKNLISIKLCFEHHLNVSDFF